MKTTTTIVCARHLLIFSDQYPDLSELTLQNFLKVP